MIEINYVLILGLGVISMVLGGLWYGPLFGKAWMRLQKIDEQATPNMIPLYVLQFVSTLLMVFVVYVFTKPAVDVMHEAHSALWLWGGIVVPILISATIWTNRPQREMLQIVAIQGGYMVVLFLIIGFAVHMWG